MAQSSGNSRVVAENRKARRNYDIEETFEAGLELVGSEVKSLRTGNVNISDAYASDEGGELFLINAHIPEYNQAARDNHAPLRRRKLLLHKREIERLVGAIQRDGMTVVPLKLYFNDRGKAKLLIALARGRKLHDKRQVERTRDWDRQKARLLRDKG